jgi:4-amino-4-deoxy-L-arabinose transferase-like glycosyltransferase
MDESIRATSMRRPVRPHPWWREGEVLILITLVCGAYFLRASDLPLRGEESRRATIAREMIWGGDWIVPRQQGEPFLSRPPLGNWLIAAATLVRGRCDVLAIRLPTLTAVLLTTLLIYAFGRTFLGRLGAFAAALAFATMGEILQMGRLAECDTVFTLLLSAALLAWSWGYQRGWPAARGWALGYALAALAALQKGPQAPVYFTGSVALVLVFRGQTRRLFTMDHLLGLSAFALIVGTWQVPFTRAMGWEAMRDIWLGDTAARFQETRPAAVIRHLVTYPVEVLGCTAPWSLLLGAYLSRRFRRSLGDAGPTAQFLAVCAAVGFLPCWASPSGMTRYYMPLYPCLALLAGLVVQRAAETKLSARLRLAWSGGWRLLAALMAGAAAVVPATRLVRHPVAALLAGPLPGTLVYAALACGAAGVVWVGARSSRRRAMRAAALGLACFLAVSYAVIIMDAMVRRSEDAATAVARLKSALPVNVRLASFGPVHHLFAYYFDDPIELRGWNDAEHGCDVNWFCYTSAGDLRIPLPFRWEEVGVIPVDRYRHPKPGNVVVVGRRISAPAGG